MKPIHKKIFVMLHAILLQEVQATSLRCNQPLIPSLCLVCALKTSLYIIILLVSHPASAEVGRTRGPTTTDGTLAVVFFVLYACQLWRGEECPIYYFPQCSKRHEEKVQDHLGS